MAKAIGLPAQAEEIGRRGRLVD